MPRLQINTRRTSLLSTNLRAVFLEALGRNVSANATRFGTRRPSDSADLQTVARRVQTDIRRETGRYCPLNQILSSIQDLSSDNCTSPVDTPLPPTPRAVSIVITASTPPSSNTSALDSPVAHRIIRQRPNLPFNLSMPPPRVPSASTSPLGSPCALTPTYTLASASFMRRSLSSGGNTSQPITPIDQIAHTPLTPPKLPRLVPCAPGTWSRLNVQARKENLSPLETPTLPLTPYPLCPMNAGKPVLGRLQIPDSPQEPGLLAAPRSAYLAPSPQALSPFDINRGQFSGALSPTLALEGTKHVLMRTSSSSNLTRSTLLRVSRPALGRSFPQSLDLRNVPDRPGSPLLSPFAGPGSPSGSPLASPFAIRPEGEYFRV